jgi:TPR repeat protein
MKKTLFASVLSLVLLSGCLDKAPSLSELKDAPNGTLIELAKEGDSNAQYVLGVRYSKGEWTEKDASQAVYWLSKSAAQGNPEGQASLGMMYFSGSGITQDYKQAALLFREAAEQGLARAQASLGILYFEGKGVERSESESFKWTKKAAEQGDVDSQYNLGHLYRNDNPVEAYAWYSVAIANGYSQVIDRQAQARNEMGRENFEKADALAASYIEKFKNK